MRTAPARLTTLSHLAPSQVVLVVPEVYDVSLPPEYFEVMRLFDWMGLNLLEIRVPLGCLGDFQRRLMLKALGPLTFVLALGVGRVLLALGVGDTASRGILRALPVTLVALFAFVPSVSSRGSDCAEPCAPRPTPSAAPLAGPVQPTRTRRPGTET